MTLLSKQTSRKIFAEREEKYGSNLPDLKAGEHILLLSNAELKNTKATNEPMLVLTFTKEGFNPLYDYYMLGGTAKDGSDLKLIGLQKLLNFFVSAFKKEIDEAEDEKDLLKQVLAYKNKKFKAAIKIQEQLYKYVKDGVEYCAITKNSKLWYAGTIDNDNFRVDISKATAMLSAADQKAYLDWKAEHPGINTEGNTQKREQLTDGPSDLQGKMPKDDGLPF
jgi:hypothetical protein